MRWSRRNGGGRGWKRKGGGWRKRRDEREKGARPRRNVKRIRKNVKRIRVVRKISLEVVDRPRLGESPSGPVLGVLEKYPPNRGGMQNF